MSSRSKKNNSSAIIAVVLMLGFLAAVIILSVRNGKKQENDSTNSVQTGSVISEIKGSTKSSKQTGSKKAVSAVSGKPAVSAESKKPTSSAASAASAAPTASKQPLYKGIYANVTWRSPYAKTADIFKHGRELMLLNKEYELPEDFKWDLVYWSSGKKADAMALNDPHTKYELAVDRAAYQPLKDMFAAAKADGVPLEMVSPYRSILHQDRLFNSSVQTNINNGMSKEKAIAKANISRTFTGTSEHNTGLGFDILEKGNWDLTESFDKTAQFKWLSEHAEEYGFILRYQKDKVDITGIMYEPWHYRYVGVKHAKRINELGMCLEEYIEYLDAGNS